MNRIVISGASGDLGRRVTALLLAEDPARELTLVTRTPDSIEATGPGVRVEPGSYENLESLESAYEGGEVLFLISGLNLGRRTDEHRRAIAAARTAGITHIVYTSVGGVQPGNPALSAIDHLQSEHDLRSSGMNFTFLRNQLYAEIVSAIWLAPAVQSGVLEMATGHGALAPVAKADIARVAAAILAEPRAHANAVYEITGPELLTMEQIVQIGADVHNTEIEYRPVTEAQRLQHFDSLGVPRTYDPDRPASAETHLWASDELVSADLAVAQGYQAILSGHVEQITGRAPTPLRDVLEQARGIQYQHIGASA